MKRKIIKSGKGFVSSLPIDWIREHNLDSGHEIELRKVGKNLVISPNKQKLIESIQLNANNIDPVIERLIPSMYRAGYHEINVNYEGPETLKHIQDVLERELIGFEIVKQGNKSCLIKDIAGMQHEAFETLLRRSFLLLIANANDCSIALKNKDIKTLKEICHRDKNINKLTNFCERLLIKDSNFSTKKIAFLFNFIKELENLADEYKYLAEHKLKTRNFNNKKGIELLDEINVILDRVYHLFYEFKKQDAAKIENEIKELKSKLLAYNKDIIFVHRLMNIYRRLKTMLSSHYSLRVE